MARLTITAVTPQGPFAALPLVADSADIAFVAESTPGDGWAIPGNTGRQLLLVRNTDASAQTVTITSVPRNGRSGDVTAYSLAAGEFAIFGGFDRAGFSQSDGTVRVEASDGTVECAVISCPASIFPNS